MAIQGYNTSPARINKFKGEILKHAVALEVLAKQGRQIALPKNQSETYVARRYVPYNATAGNPNVFFQNVSGDRGTAMANAHLTQEGVTPQADTIVAQDITAVINQYSCLYSFTDKVADLYEDDIPKAMVEQVGERVALVNEMILFGALKACTNVFYSGTGTSIATVNDYLKLANIRKITKAMQANHARPVTNTLKASPNIATQPVESGYVIVCHTDLEPDLRDIAGFIPTSQYASGTPMPNEIGRVERFRFITSPDLPAQLSAGAAIGSTGCQSTLGTSIDVYPYFVFAQDAFSQIALRGKESMSPTFIPAGEKTKSDPHGQRGYAGSIWWKGVMIENNQWMALGYTGVKSL
ncbi:MAG TPA: N4-gp56 family major capsid protein [Methylotenera mobilis]|uniref:N4-gp56 family major capsid protein n=1 Tax=Methylotenera mobilis TaxID=359408 RepID=A0A351RD29_9PROT|nr:N4-gp56 family major capsid protein [Methylotenera mobilis]